MAIPTFHIFVGIYLSSVNKRHLLHIYIFTLIQISLKTTFSVDKLIPKNAQTTTLYMKWSLYITLNMIYYIRQE